MEEPVAGAKARMTGDIQLLQESNIPTQHAGQIVVILQTFLDEQDKIICIKTSDGRNHLVIWGQHVMPLTESRGQGCPLCASVGIQGAISFYCSNKDCKNYRS